MRENGRIFSFLSCTESVVCDGCTQRCYPAQLFVLQCQHPRALREQFHLDSRQRVCGGEVPLGPPAERHDKSHTGGLAFITAVRTERLTGEDSLSLSLQRALTQL